jgi:hypothetical protein
MPIDARRAGGTRVGLASAAFEPTWTHPVAHAHARVAAMASKRHHHHLYDPIAPLWPVANRLERLPLERFPAELLPQRIALVTWTDRLFSEHLSRNAAYCRRWGYACFWNETRRLPRLPQTFEKLPLVRWALERYDVVLQIDDDASVHRPHQPLGDFLRTFPTASLIASSAGWDVPDGPGRFKTTWDVPTTVHPKHPTGVRPSTYAPQGGLLLWRRSRYSLTLLDALLANNAHFLTRYAAKCCYEQDAITAATRTSWMLHVGLLPMHAFNCFPGDLNTYGRCVEPFVLHVAGAKAKNDVHGNFEKMITL